MTAGSRWVESILPPPVSGGLPTAHYPWAFAHLSNKNIRTGRHLGGTRQDHPEDPPLFSHCCTAEIGLLVSPLSDKGCSDTYFCRPYEYWRRKYRVRTAHTE